MMTHFSFDSVESGYWLMLMEREVKFQVLFKVIKTINKRIKNSTLREEGERQKYHVFLEIEPLKIMVIMKFIFFHKNNVLIVS